MGRSGARPHLHRPDDGRDERGRQLSALAAPVGHRRFGGDLEPARDGAWRIRLRDRGRRHRRLRAGQPAVRGSQE